MTIVPPRTGPSALAKPLKIALDDAANPRGKARAVRREILFKDGSSTKMLTPHWSMELCNWCAIFAARAMGRHGRNDLDPTDTVEEKTPAISPFDAPYSQDDAELATSLLGESALTPQQERNIDQVALLLIGAIRDFRWGIGGLEDILREYSLSTKRAWR